MALPQALDESTFDTFNNLGLVVMQIILSLLTSNLGVTSVTHIFDRYDSEIPNKQLDGQRDNSCICHQWSTSDSKLSNINGETPQRNQHWHSASRYLSETTPQIIKENQSVAQAEGFNSG